MAKFDPWELPDALDLFRKLKTELHEAGWGAALGGSILLTGFSKNDIDIIIFPLSTSMVDHQEFRDALTSQGLTQVWRRDEIAKFWQRQGSTDTKHVEVWEYEGKRVDIFVLS